MARNAVNQASNAEVGATQTAANLGGAAAGVNSTLTPFLTQELEHPQGYSPTDTSAMLAAGMGGAGGATAGITGMADQEAARTGNASGFTAALDDAARMRTKAAAGSSEGIASQDAALKQQQQQDAAHGLQVQSSEDTSGMLSAMGQESNDVDAQARAQNSGWMQNLTNIVGAIRGR